MIKLTETQKARYDRNIRIPEIGRSGQDRLCTSRVLVVGAGGLGSPALFYLASAGVGTIGLIDGDRVDVSNLQRQILHSTEGIGRSKVDSAMETLSRLNPDVHFEGYSVPFTCKNGDALVSRYDFVVEATDNFESKFLVNDTCIRQRVPFSHAGVLGLYGQTMTVLPGQGPCFRCVFGEAPQEDQVASTRDVGVLGAVAGVLGSIQAAEAVKYLVGCGEPLVGRLLTFDAARLQFREVPLPKPSCPVCREAGLIERAVR
jgi:molybdopterin/thiamine biosynthesis adenylyltransferase